MGLSKSKQEKQNEQAQSYWTNMSQQAYNNAQTVTPLEKTYTEQQQKFLDWDNSTGKDVRNAPGIDSYIQLGQASLNKAQQDRMGTGALALSAEGSGGYAQKLKQLSQSERADNFGAGLENALALRRAEATNSVLPLASLQQQRNNAQLSAATGMTGMYLNRPQKKPFWQELILAGVSGGSQIASAGMA